jgi:2-oxoisovalerate dehydrogenase E2 component (dihydrolipoyl transacylase)
MPEQAVVMPKVGESVTEGTVLQWLKADGDMVEVDEALVEVETEKVNVEIPSPWAGKLRIAVQEGETVKVDDPLAFIEVAVTSGAGRETKAQARQAAAMAGPVASPGRVAAAPPDGRGGANGAQPPGNGSRAHRYSPAVLNLAREHNIDLTQLHGTGLFGRITRKDVLAYVEARSRGDVETQPEPVASAERRADAEIAGGATRAGEELVPLTPMRRTIAERMSRSVREIPHVWLMMEADVTGLVRLRARVKDAFRTREGVDLSYLPFAIHAVVESLKDHPVLNSSWSDQGILLKKQHNIGVAVATEHGLVVPVIHQAGDLSIPGLARRVADLAERARARRLRIEDVEGGTFTVDNTGAFGSIVSVPIINHPQAAIMTIEAVVQRPVVVNDAIAIRHMVNLCLSFDHRVTDGAEAGAFLQAVKRRLESITDDSDLV